MIKNLLFAICLIIFIAIMSVSVALWSLPPLLIGYFCGMAVMGYVMINKEAGG